MANLEKNALINLQNDVHLEDTYNTNIVFSTADQNGDTLRFQVLKDDGLPYIIGEVNVGGKIKLDHEDGSFWIDELKVVEKNKSYQFEYQLPNALLQRNGKVTAQVLVYEKGTSKLVVAQRKFTFTIQNSIYQNISAEDKTTYIMEFAQLEQDIRATAVDINETLAKGSDYVTQIKTAHKEALDAINTLLTSSTQELRQLGDEKIQTLQQNAETYLSQIETKNQEAQQKVDDFKNYLIDKKIVLTTDTANWQKYKLTADGGYRIYLKKGSFNNVLDLATGYYETVVNGSASTQGFPTSISDSAYVEVDVMKTDNARMQIKVVQSSNGRTFIKNIHTNGDDTIGWKEIAFNDPNNPLETTTGSQAKATTAETNAKAYIDTRHKVLFDGNASGVNSTITLQDDYTNYSLIVLSGSFPGGEWTKAHLVANTKSIHIGETNLVDDTAKGGANYEMLLQKTNSRTLTIGLDNYLELISDNAYTNANKFVVQRIEGWK